MFNYFPRLGSKGKDVQGLLKNSVTLLGKDIDVFKPSIYMTFIKSIRIVTIFFAFYCFFISDETGKGMLTVLALFIMAPIISYFNMKYKAITCWMIYDVLRGIDTDVSKGKNELKGLGFTLFLYSIIDHIIKSATNNSQQEKSGGIVNLIKGIILSVFQEVWDLIKNFSLPSIVIDKVSLTEIPNKLKLIKKNIPGALVGILGIDIVGSVFVSLFSFIQLPSFLIGVGAGYYAKAFLPEAWLITLPLKTPFVINLLPLFITLTCTSIFVSFLNSLVHLVKTTYFTTFYVSISRPNEIDESLRDGVTNYLNFNDRLEGHTFFKSRTPQAEQAHDLDKDTGEDLQLIKKISNTFRKNVAKGLSEKKIYSALHKKGYSKEQLNAGLKRYRSKKSA